MHDFRNFWMLVWILVTLMSLEKIRYHIIPKETNSIRERTIIGSVLYKSRNWVYRIVSATVVSADITCITAGSADVNRSHYTAYQRTFAPVTRCMRSRHLIHDTGEGWRGGRRETVTWYQPPRDTKTVQYWVLATSECWCLTPTTSRKW